MLYFVTYFEYPNTSSATYVSYSTINLKEAVKHAVSFGANIFTQCLDELLLSCYGDFFLFWFIQMHILNILKGYY